MIKDVLKSVAFAAGLGAVVSIIAWAFILIRAESFPATFPRESKSVRSATPRFVVDEDESDDHTTVRVDTKTGRRYVSNGHYMIEINQEPLSRSDKIRSEK